MALEDLLTKLITSIDANTAAIKASGGGSAGGTVAAGKPAKAESKAAAKAEPEIDFDVVKAAAGKVLDKMGKAFTKKLIKDVGGANELATVKKEKFGALLTALQATLDKPEDDADEDEDEL